MGIIKKQSIRSTIFTYAGVIVGFFNSAILLPMLFSTEEVGLLGFLSSLTAILATVFTFGVPLITMKLFPYFRSENGNNGFFSFTIFTSILGIVFGGFFYYSFDDLLISSKNNANDLINFSLILIIVFATKVTFRNVDSYLRMMYKTVIGIALEGFVLKLVIFCTLLFTWLVIELPFTWVFVFFGIALMVPGIISLLYAFTLDFKLSATRFTKHLGGRKKELLSIGLFGLLGGIGSVIILEVDRVMISNMLGLSQNGIYSVAFFFGLFISIPARGLKRIAAVIISDSLERDDIDTVAKVYRKSCANQLLVAGYLFLGIWFSIDYLFEFMKPEYAQGKYVVLFIGLAQVIDLATGVNAEIIYISKYYRYNTYLSVALIVLVIGLNYLMIPVWGITGSAIASFASLLTINVLRALLLFKKMDLQPYTRKTVLNIILIGTVFLLLFVIPKFENPFVGILISGSILTIVYWIPSYFLSISEDINTTVDNVIKRIRR